MDSGKVNKWIRDNISGINKPLKLVEVTCLKGKITHLFIDKTLTQADKTKIINKFPELTGKEVN